MDKLKIAKVENVDAIRGGQILRGTLHLTSHHLIYIGTPASPSSSQQSEDASSKPKQREMWMAFPIIAFCIFRPTAPGSGFPSSIRIRCRDFTFVTFNFGDDKQARDAFDSIKALTCKLGSIDKLHAFSYRPPKPERDFNGWELYDAKAEWKRQGISEKGLDRGWRISKINEDYSFSPTYPSLLVVPSSISDNVLNYAGRYRSRVRLPALTYLHPVNNCSITRCAQPLTGLRGNRSIQDEKLVLACFSASGPTAGDKESPPASISSPSSSQDELPPPPPVDGEITDTEQLEDEVIAATATESKEVKPQIYGAQQHNMIVDARPTVNALAMQAVGLGSENMDNYRFATKVYLGIDNIHVMRESLAKVIEALKDGDVSPLPPNRELLAKSNWLKHIQGLLDGSALIARQVGIHHSHVLIHCSDGWDRTSQLSALSQLLLDPYYRTLDGFIVLIEKDWLSFGHMFQHRSGYLSSEKWFQTQNDGLAGSAIQPGGSDGRGDALENALQSAKRFFNKNNQSSDSMADLDSDMLPEDSPSSKRASKDKDSDATKPKETSPVFHQFLDATYQLLRQHPTRFEFNERFLRRLLYHLYSCQYGTFLYNNEKARRDANLRERTRSVWDYFLCRREEFINKDYDPEIDDHKRGHERLIFPDLSKLRWWHEVFGRSDEEMNGLNNPVIDRYLAASPKPATQTTVTGTETSDVASGVGTTRKITNGAASGFASIKEGISGLGIGKPKGSPRSRSPMAKEAMEVEMQ